MAEIHKLPKKQRETWQKQYFFSFIFPILLSLLPHKFEHCSISGITGTYMDFFPRVLWLTATLISIWRLWAIWDLDLACENIRFSSLFVAGDTSAAAKSEEKRMFSQANLDHATVQNNSCGRNLNFFVWTYYIVRRSLRNKVVRGGW